MLWGKAAEIDAPTFFSSYAPLAKEEMRTNKIPASIKLAQAAYESGWGESELATNAINYFGIKCKSNCENAYYKVDDDRDASGTLVPSPFNVYTSVEESFKAHSEFLKSNSRYNFLFEELDITDFEGWARGLQKAKYATNPNYANTIIRIIKEYELFQYDYQVIGTSFTLDTSITDAQSQMLEAAKPGFVVQENMDNNYSPQNIKHEDGTLTTSPSSNATISPENPNNSSEYDAPKPEGLTQSSFEEVHGELGQPVDIENYKSFNEKNIEIDAEYQVLLNSDVEKNSEAKSSSAKTLNDIEHKDMIDGGLEPR